MLSLDYAMTTSRESKAAKIQSSLRFSKQLLYNSCITRNVCDNTLSLANCTKLHIRTTQRVEIYSTQNLKTPSYHGQQNSTISSRGIPKPWERMHKTLVSQGFEHKIHKCLCNPAKMSYTCACRKVCARTHTHKFTRARTLLEMGPRWCPKLLIPW